MKPLSILCLSLLFLSPLTFAKHIIGIYEEVSLPTEGLILKAKIDSGAKNSSLHALNINLYQQNGKDWVSFETVDAKGDRLSLSAPVFRTAEIKRHNGKNQFRPVILTGVCINNVKKNVEVSLIDRTVFKFPLLIGRSYIKDDFLIDVTKQYTVKPNC